MTVGLTQARRHEDRNVQIYTAWLFGASQRDLAAEWHMSAENVKRICSAVEASAPERSRAVLNDRLTEAGLMMLRQSRELFEKPAPPITSGKDGNIVYDPDSGEVARDYSAKIRAGEFMLKVIDRLSKLAGADAPMQIQIESGATQAAIEQASEVVDKFHGLRVVS